jgi:large subunit ribosomal protein L3
MNIKTLGLLGEKVGMTQIFDENGNVVPVTVVKIAENVITAIKTEEKDGYNAIQLGSFATKEKALNKPKIGQFKKNDLPLFRKLKEFRVKEGEIDLKVGDEINLEEFFKDLEKVNLTSTSIGKGFQGFVKAHNGHIGRRSHGSKSHRQIGSLGAGTDPSRVFPGKKMPTMLGNKTVTVPKVKVHSFDAETKVLLVKGTVPGKPGAQVKVTASGALKWNHYNKKAKA